MQGPVGGELFDDVHGTGWRLVTMDISADAIEPASDGGGGDSSGGDFGGGTSDAGGGGDSGGGDSSSSGGDFS